MPYVAQVAVGKRECLGVFGNDYKTHDGTGVRDYVHVVDLADGHVKALEKIKENCGVKIYNLGTGKGSSVLDVVHAYEKACGKKIPYELSLIHIFIFYNLLNSFAEAYKSAVLSMPVYPFKPFFALTLIRLSAFLAAAFAASKRS